MTDGLMVNLSVRDLKKIMNEPQCVVCKKELDKVGVCSDDCAKMLTRELLRSHPKALGEAIEEYNLYMKDLAKDNKPKGRKK